MSGKFFGKHRGTVMSNLDPMHLGRLLVIVPEVMGLPPLANWAMPCVPYAGPQVGFVAIPPIGAKVWIEFEDGNPAYPIWTGCFWGELEMPAEAILPSTVLFKTNFTTLKIDDLTTSLEITVLTPAGPMLVRVDPTGIRLTNVTASVSISPESIELRNAAASIDVKPAEVSIDMPPARVSITPASISLQLGAASVNLTPVEVDINNGALEVM